MPTKIAILDLGTNTFHLLILSYNPKGKENLLYKDRAVVKLAEDGSDKIGSVPFERGVQAMIGFNEVIRKYKIDKVYALATAGVRSANNGEDFLKVIENFTGIEVQCISGDTEARLIYYGVLFTGRLNEEVSLIMDIGGGSVEFIIADHKKIYWKQSLAIGAAVIKRKFHKTEPISTQEQQDIIAYLEAHLQALFDQLEKFQVKCLIGCSGSFETIAEMIIHHYPQRMKDFKATNFYEIDLILARAFHERFLHTTLIERLEMKGLAEMRADMIVVASLLIDFVIKKGNIEKLILSKYALKEGVLWTIKHKLQII